MLKRSASGRAGSANARGFSLLEVMIALVVLCVGLLGILKLEAAAISSTSIASQRSLAALEASSLAASMHVNRGYWAGSDPAGATIQVSGTAPAVTNLAPNLAASLNNVTTTTCQSVATPCGVSDMAAYDLKVWAASLKLMLPNYRVTINCGAVSPISCIINMNWTEKAVAINTQEAAAQGANPAALAVPSYTLYVEP